MNAASSRPSVTSALGRLARCTRARNSPRASHSTPTSTRRTRQVRRRDSRTRAAADAARATRRRRRAGWRAPTRRTGPAARETMGAAAARSACGCARPRRESPGRRHNRRSAAPGTAAGRHQPAPAAPGPPSAALTADTAHRAPTTNSPAANQSGTLSRLTGPSCPPITMPLRLGREPGYAGVFPRSALPNPATLFRLATASRAPRSPPGCGPAGHVPGRAARRSARPAPGREGERCTFRVHVAAGPAPPAGSTASLCGGRHRYRIAASKDRQHGGLDESGFLAEPGVGHVLAVEAGDSGGYGNDRGPVGHLLHEVHPVALDGQLGFQDVVTRRIIQK